MVGDGGGGWGKSENDQVRVSFSDILLGEKYKLRMREEST